MNRQYGARSRAQGRRRLLVVLAAAVILALVLGSVISAVQAQVAGDPGQGLLDQWQALFDEAAGYLRRYGIVTGDPDGNLRPLDTLTRAEAAKILVVAAGRAEAAAAWTGEAPFPDVAPEAWYAGYVATARDLGLVGGYPDGTFRPKGLITYAEMAALVARLLGVEPRPDQAWPGNYLSALSQAGLIPPELAPLVPLQANQPARRDVVMTLIHYAFREHVIDGLNYYQRNFEAVRPPAGEPAQDGTSLEDGTVE